MRSRSEATIAPPKKRKFVSVIRNGIHCEVQDYDVSREPNKSGTMTGKTTLFHRAAAAEMDPEISTSMTQECL